MLSRLTHPHSTLTRLKQGTAIVALSALSLLSGYSPDRILTRQSTGTPIASAQESSFTRYVRAVYEIEEQRAPLMAQVKTMTGGDAPENVCSSGFAQLPNALKSDIRNICNQFNGKVNGIIARYGFGNNPGEFNSYQQQAMSSDRKVRREMQQRIANEMKRLGLR